MRYRHLFVLAAASTWLSVFSATAHAQVDQVQSYHTCANPNSNPASNEVYVYSDANFHGSCAALYQGFYPNAGYGGGGFGLPNDSLSSLKVGSAVRARLFSDGVYGAYYYWFNGGSNNGTLTSIGWDNITSSIRVENNARSATCNDLNTGEFAVFRDVNFGGDCVVLYYGHNYSDPVSMGIANDSVSSIDCGPTYPVNCTPARGYYVFGYQGSGYSGSYELCYNGFRMETSVQYNDQWSSIYTTQIGC